MKNLRRQIKTVLTSPLLIGIYARYLATRSPSSQFDEGVLLRTIADTYDVPRSFVECGFHPREFNCCVLTKDFEGLLVDGDQESVKMASSLLPHNIKAVNRFLTLDNLDVIFDYCRGKALGVLSVDVDGNDYWFLEKLITLKPAVVVAEYNASFGMRSITVPYSPTFDRHANHESGWYHGASLAALHGLCASNEYSLVAVSEGGCNAFFLRNHFGVPGLSPNAAYRENVLRNRWSTTTAAEQWDRLKDMPFTELSSPETTLRD